jgi:hypothetical protein
MGKPPAATGRALKVLPVSVAEPLLLPSQKEEQGARLLIKSNIDDPARSIKPAVLLLTNPAVRAREEV